MINHVSALIKQAIITFTSSASKTDSFNRNFDKLKCLLNETTATDINLNPNYLSEALWKMKDKAPVSYIKIFEDNLVSVGVFLLKPGMKLPLHDHPQMYGLIKVLSGKVKITSFSILYDSLDKYNATESLYSPMITAECTTNEEIISSASECCVLEPSKSNLHEIESVDGAAAFLDILSPPYDSDIPNIGPRKCSYFKILQQISSNKYLLEEMSPPSWYWNDVLPYSGPEIQL